MSQHNQAHLHSNYRTSSSSPVPSRFVSSVPWRQCILCEGETFKSPREFSNHLLIQHCKKEGGSYICLYGTNSICQTLPLEGVSERDYESHVNRVHISPSMAAKSASLQKEPQSSSVSNSDTKPLLGSTTQPLSASQHLPVQAESKPIKELTSILIKSSSSPVLTNMAKIPSETTTTVSSTTVVQHNTRKSSLQMDEEISVRDKLAFSKKNYCDFFLHLS